MLCVKTLLTSYLANINHMEHDPAVMSVLDAEIETFLMEETSIGDMENRFFQMRDIHKIKRFVKQILEEEASKREL